MLFLIPLAEGLVEGAAVLAESTAVRTAVVEAGEMLVSAETREAISSYAINEGRALTAQLATAEGRQALVEGVARGASELTGQVASKSGQLWEAAKGLWESEEGAAALAQAGKQAAKTTLKGEALNEGGEYAMDKLTDKVQDVMMDKMLNFFDGSAVDPGKLEALSKDAAAFGTRFNLGQDLSHIAGDLAKPGQGMDHVPELQAGLEMARGTVPGKEAQLESMAVRAEALSQLDTEEVRVRAEMAGGHVSPESMGALQSSMHALLDKTEGKAHASLSNALDSLSHVKPGDDRHALAEAMAELSVAKDRVLQGLSQDASHLSADIAHQADLKKADMGHSLDPLVPDIVHKNEQEWARSAEQQHARAEPEHVAQMEMAH